MGSVPSSYHHLNFSGFSVFEPRNPALRHIISPHDTNCAISHPNALVGSRFISPNSSEFAIPSINVDTKSAEEAKLQPHFGLLSLWIKPLDAPSPGTSVYIKGSTAEGKEDYGWHVDFPHGYYEPLHVKIKEFTGVVWKELEKVEIWADFGYDRLDWEFCIDDVEICFDKLEGSSSEPSKFLPSVPGEL